ncbi:MAG TPA: dienelactone hydrolase family protein [Polyangiaceae bacterium]|nr:dienelactone hydrolase family protein [Polyangiaceae bacterium]
MAEIIQYFSGEIALCGELYVSSPDERRPLVVVAHGDAGLTDFERERAQALAGAGYTAFAIDLYGSAVTPRSPRRMLEEASLLLANRMVLRDRMLAALHTARAVPCVDPTRVAVVGYGLGGVGGLELARKGEPIVAAACFHSLLSAPHGPSPARVEAKVLALLGSDDPFVGLRELELFEEEMRRLGVDYFVVRFGGASAAFAEAGHCTDAASGFVHEPRAARRAWRILLGFLEETLGVP